MVSKYREFIIERLLSKIDESVLYYSDDIVVILTKMKKNGSEIASKLLDIHLKDIDTDVNLISTGDVASMLTFVPDKKAKTDASPYGEDWIPCVVVDAGQVYTSYTALYKSQGLTDEYLKGFEEGTRGWFKEITFLNNTFRHFKVDINDPKYKPGHTIDAFYTVDGLSDKVKFDSKNRNPIKVARLVRKLLSIENIKVTDAELEKFVNEYKAQYDILNDKFSNFQIVSGEDIKEYYLYTNYESENSGSLGGSCMRHENAQSYFNIYTRNPEVVRMVVLTNPITEKVTGRALLWKAFVNRTSETVQFMDRIYCKNDHDVNIFKEYAKANGFCHKRDQESDDTIMLVYPDGTVNSEVLYVKLTYADFEKYPYLDSLKYLNKRAKTISNEECDRCITLESQYGTYDCTCDGDGEVECRYCDGEGKVSCDTCYGDGELDCHECDTAGTIEDPETGESVKCETCQGRGLQKCEDCNRGYHYCDHCDGEGKVPCSRCCPED